jgi:Phytanoyl-CoA dioxygenase (PhyH)
VKNSADSVDEKKSDLATRLESLHVTNNAVQLTIRGYTVVDDAASVEFFQRLRETILRCHARARSEVLVGMLLKEDRIFEDAVCNAKLTALAEFMCGQGFILSQMVGTVRATGERGLRIHTDYNLMRDPFPPFPQVLTAVWACDEFTEAGGCTRLVPGSHRHRRHPLSELREGEDQAIPVECPFGSIVLWDGATWHGSCARRKDGERVALHIMFNRMVLRTFEQYELPQDVLDRNPPVLAAMLGMNDPFGKSTTTGVNMELTRRAAQTFRS